MNDLCKMLNKKEIHQKLIELKKRTIKSGKEYAFVVCCNGKISKIIGGMEDKVYNDKLYRLCNYKIDLDIHSHPKILVPYPSVQDIFMNMLNPPKIASCVYGEDNNSIICYQTSDKIKKEFTPKMKKIEDKVIDLLIEYEEAKSLNKRRELNLSLKQLSDEYNQLKNKVFIIFISDILNIKKVESNIKKYEALVYVKQKFGNFKSVKIEYCGELK